MNIFDRLWRHESVIENDRQDAQAVFLFQDFQGVRAVFAAAEGHDDVIGSPAFLSVLLENVIKLASIFFPVIPVSGPLHFAVPAIIANAVPVKADAGKGLRKNTVCANVHFFQTPSAVVIKD
jgi:hypothetical protein